MIPLLPSLALVALTSAPAPALTPAPAPAPSRLEQLVEANILGTHAFQVALAKKEGRGDPACYSPGALTDAQLASLETHQAAFRSTDRGETWTRIRGFNFKWGQRVIPDPVDASKIYVTTFGGSVWHGPAAGDPGSTEDVVR